MHFGTDWGPIKPDDDRITSMNREGPLVVLPEARTPSPQQQSPSPQQQAPDSEGGGGKEGGAPSPQGAGATPQLAANAEAKKEAEGEEQEASEATVSEGRGGAQDGGDGDGEASSRLEANADYGDFLQQQYSELMQKLKEYKEKHGDVNVPRDYVHDPKLGAWVYEQRERGRKGALPKDRYDALSELGFVWESPNDIIWREKYERLLVYKEIHGDCAVPGTYTADPALAVWVKYQRDAKRRGRLGERQVKLLEEIGFQWELALEKQWNDKYEKLKVYQQTYGDCNVPYNFSEDPGLGMWVKYQRDAKRRGRINHKYRDMLDALSFQWEPTLDKQWNDRFEKLKAFQRDHGHTNVPSSYKDQALVTWIGHQREAHKSGKLSSVRVKKLNSIGFQWVAVSWGEMYSKLVHYYEAHGNTNVPPNWQPDPALSHWVHDQRVKLKKGKLSDNHRARLEQIFFSFEIPKGGQKKRKPDEVAGNGDGGIPPRDPKVQKQDPVDGSASGRAEDPAVSTEQGADRELPGGNSTGSTAKAAAEYGDYLQSQWRKQLTKLELFKAAHGHCEVPRDWAEDPSMNSWISDQRDRFCKGQLAADREEALNRLGFQWRTQADIQWDEHFERLVAYSKKYGNAQVPQTFAEDQKLANWCTYQRERIRKGKMPPERLERLEAIGFEWEPVLERQWNEKFEKLRAFKDANGHCQVPWMYPEDPQLPTWVKTQRERRRKSKLPPAYIQRLNNLGFVWNPLAQRGSPGGGDGQQPSSADTPEQRRSDPGTLAFRPSSDTEDQHGSQASILQAGLVDPAQIHSMAAALKRSADALSLYAGQVSDVNSKNRRLSEKLKASNARRATAEQQRDEAQQKLAAQASTVKSLERKLELMTSALDRAEQQITSMQKDVATAAEEKGRLEAALASAAGRSNGEDGGAAVQNGFPGETARNGSSGPSSERLCRMCRERPASCVVMPCMHLLYCRPCLDTAQKTAKVCPGCETACLSVMDVQLEL